MTVYAVVNREGEIKRSKRSHHLMIYVSPKTAQRAALCDGDAVVEVNIDLTREPLFIRSRR